MILGFDTRELGSRFNLLPFPSFSTGLRQSPKESCHSRRTAEDGPARASTVPRLSLTLPVRRILLQGEWHLVIQRLVGNIVTANGPTFTPFPPLPGRLKIKYVLMFQSNRTIATASSEYDTTIYNPNSSAEGWRNNEYIRSAVKLEAEPVRYTLRVEVVEIGEGQVRNAASFPKLSDE